MFEGFKQITTIMIPQLFFTIVYQDNLHCHIALCDFPDWQESQFLSSKDAVKTTETSPIPSKILQENARFTVWFSCDLNNKIIYSDWEKLHRHALNLKNAILLILRVAFYYLKITQVACLCIAYALPLKTVYCLHEFSDSCVRLHGL